MVELYTIPGCPKCKIIKTKLNMKKISFVYHENSDLIKELGFMSAPILKVGDKYLKFEEANTWINQQK